MCMLTLYISAHFYVFVMLPFFIICSFEQIKALRKII